MCHIILASPILALPLFMFLPFNAALTAYIAVVLGSALIYFKIVAAMKLKVQTGMEGMAGEEAVVVERLNPDGKVKYGEEIWDATAGKKQISTGKRVRISHFEGLRLIVQPLNEKMGSDPGSHCLPR